ncbi:MAG: hypothetical protein Q7S09_04240 [bacterium]|nr:hypothetical protein [bacterium]
MTLPLHKKSRNHKTAEESAVLRFLSEAAGTKRVLDGSRLMTQPPTTVG